MGKRKQIVPIGLKPQKKGSTTLVQANPKVYRNQPCTCGSGVKAKKCCYGYRSGYYVVE
ncbi:SEC-C motif protein [Croceibacter phage P2559Y]|uniref:SEC-C motif protein n=1 Tax=Croceibacter phage P2559Y TaxID=1327037 RepID=UPI0003F4AA61|nr:SEC-C motif protein [Croceibacter phage P2559Y]AGM14107.1 SEC-C motif protein [Croceibacter phage P2559Y]